ncbi:hypothetical protein [Micromonospora sp. NPDC005313]|uniref:hypothetical protein n=1 Tax=unclassified Micromonospora TaxID=2617518 RepID=UPI0033BBE9D2
MAARQLKLGLRVRDLDRSQGRVAGLGFVRTVPTANLDVTYALWRDEGLPVTLEPEDVGWARIFYGLDPDGYEVMFEQFHPVTGA